MEGSTDDTRETRGVRARFQERLRIGGTKHSMTGTITMKTGTVFYGAVLAPSGVFLIAYALTCFGLR